MRQSKLNKTLMVAVVLGAALTPSTAMAQFAFGGDAPVAVAAEKATYEGGLTILEGNVDVQQSGVRIQSNTMDIYRAEADPDAAGSLKLGNVTRIVAKGNFRYTSPENSVSGDQGIYERDTGTITVTGDVTFKTASGSSVKGKKLIYDVKEKTAKFGDECTGDNCKGDRITFSSEQ